MPVGGIRSAAEDIKQRREAGSKGGRRYFKLADGETKTVRFLEEGEGIHWCWTHKMPPVGNQKWGDDVPCLNQNDDGTACPGCEEGLPKKFKGFITMIERDAPKFKRDADGKIDWNEVVGSEDAVVVWESGITVFEELDSLDADFGGLTSRDFKIKRKGTKLNTTYTIRPANPDAGRQEMSEKDKELAANKPSLKADITPGTYDEMARRLRGGGGNGGGGGGDSSNAPAASDINPFMVD